MIQINKPSLEITFGTTSPNKNYYEVKQTHSNKIISLHDIKTSQYSS